MDGIAVMRKGTRIDHDSLCSVKISILDPVYDRTFMIALEYFDFAVAALPLIGDHLKQSVVIGCPVNSFFPDSQKIEIGSVNNQNIHLCHLHFYF